MEEIKHPGGLPARTEQLKLGEGDYVRAARSRPSSSVRAETSDKEAKRDVCMMASLCRKRRASVKPKSRRCPRID